MTFNEMIEKIYNYNGVGAVFFRNDGTRPVYFYEDFPGDGLGIDRASRDFNALHEAGKAHKAAYYWRYNKGCATVGEKIKVHFIDWITHKVTPTRQDDQIYTVYRNEGNAGIDYAGEFTPLSSFADTGVVFEIIK